MSWALPSSVNMQSHLTSSFTDDGNTSWYSVCRVLMVEWLLDCENCRHLTVIGLHDTGPWYQVVSAEWHVHGCTTAGIRQENFLRSISFRKKYLNLIIPWTKIFWQRKKNPTSLQCSFWLISYLVSFFVNPCWTLVWLHPLVFWSWSTFIYKCPSLGISFLLRDLNTVDWVQTPPGLGKEGVFCQFVQFLLATVFFGGQLCSSSFKSSCAFTHTLLLKNKIGARQKCSCKIAAFLCM